MGRRAVAALLASGMTVAGTIVLAPSAAAGPAHLERLSVNSAGQQGPNTPGFDSDQPSITPNGRYVVFTSWTPLSAADTNGWADVYVRDRQANTTELVSVGTTGVSANDTSSSPTISDDGTKIAFLSPASDVVPGDSNNVADAFVRDMTTHTTTLVSLDTTGAQLTAAITEPTLSGDAQTIVFGASSTVIPSIPSTFPQLYARHLTTGAIDLVSSRPDGGVSNRNALHPQLSTDARYVAFQSDATDLMAGVTGFQVFLRDRTTGTIELASRAPDGSPGNNESGAPHLSADGNVVGFETRASNLVPEGNNGKYQSLVRNRALNTMQVVSRSLSGGLGDDGSIGAAISPDGAFAGFYSNATNLVSGDTNGFGDIFVRDLGAGTTRRVNVSNTGAQANLFSSGAVGVSTGGAVTVFASSANNLITPDGNSAVRDIYAAVAAVPDPKISGRVTDGVAGSPLSFIRVTWTNTSTGASANTVTSASGNYTTPILPAGTYKVGFQDLVGGRPPQWWNNQPSLAAATPIVLGALPITGIDAVMTRPGIYGRVTNAAGTPIAGVIVGAQSGNAYAEATTAGDGTYRVNTTVAGNYKIHFTDSHYQYSPEWWDDQDSDTTAAPVAFTPGQVVTGINATLSLTTITGRVTDANGQGIAGITVGAQGAAWYGETTTTANGTYLIQGLATDTYKVSFRDGTHHKYSPEWWDDQDTDATAAPLDMARGDAVSNIDATLIETTLSGRVTDANGQPLAGITVGAESSAFYAESITAADGTYTLAGLMTGAYKIAFRDSAHYRYSTEFWDDQDSESTAAVINVVRGDAIAGIDASLSETSLSGRATDASGQPLAGITVGASSATWYAEAVTGPDGTYTLNALAAGSYKVSFLDHQNHFVSQWWDGKNTAASATPVIVSRGTTTTGINATMLTNDHTAPSVSIASPVDGGSYSLNQPLAADYACADNSAVASCTASTPSGGALDTSVAGTHALVVTAVDFGGNVTTVTATYEILAGTVDQEVSGGDVVTTDPGGQGASPEVPVQTEIVVPDDVSGHVSASAEPAGSNPTGFQLFDTQIVLDGPPASDPEHPYTVSFTVDASQLSGAAPESIQVFRNATPVAACTSATAADPDPCMVSAVAAPDGSGDAIVTVRTLHFSVWTLGLEDADLTAPAVSFGTIDVGTSASKVVTLTNSGGIPASISALSLDGDNAGDFAITGETCTTAGPLVHAATCTVTVKAAPTTSGVRFAAIRIVHNGPTSPEHVALFATGRDVTPPDTTITARPPATSNDTTPTFAFTATEPATFQCRVDSGAWKPCASPYTTAPLADGQHTFSVRAIDVAGNVDPVPATASYTMEPTCSLLLIQVKLLGPTLKVCLLPVRT